ncbi:hypothetical protein AAIB98_001499 [Providencia rettgeri]
MLGYQPKKQDQELLASAKRKELMNFINQVDNLIIKEELKVIEVLRCFGIILAKHQALDEVTLTEIKVNLPPKKP